MSKYNDLLKMLHLVGQDLDSPAAQQESHLQDMDPRNFRMIDKEMQRTQGQPVAQGALMEERKRLEMVHMQKLQQAAQQFAPRLAQELDVSTHTGLPTSGPADNMIKLMLMMRRRMAPRMMAQQEPQQAPVADNPVMGQVQGY